MCGTGGNDNAGGSGDDTFGTGPAAQGVMGSEPTESLGDFSDFGGLGTVGENGDVSYGGPDDFGGPADDNNSNAGPYGDFADYGGLGTPDPAFGGVLGNEYNEEVSYGDPTAEAMADANARNNFANPLNPQNFFSYNISKYGTKAGFTPDPKNATHVAVMGGLLAPAAMAWGINPINVVDKLSKKDFVGALMEGAGGLGGKAGIAATAIGLADKAGLVDINGAISNALGLDTDKATKAGGTPAASTPSPTGVTTSTAANAPTSPSPLGTTENDSSNSNSPDATFGRQYSAAPRFTPSAAPQQVVRSVPSVNNYGTTSSYDANYSKNVLNRDTGEDERTLVNRPFASTQYSNQRRGGWSNLVRV